MRCCRALRLLTILRLLLAACALKGMGAQTAREVAALCCAHPAHRRITLALRGSSTTSTSNSRFLLIRAIRAGDVECGLRAVHRRSVAGKLGGASADSLGGGASAFKTHWAERRFSSGINARLQRH